MRLSSPPELCYFYTHSDRSGICEDLELVSKLELVSLSLSPGVSAGLYWSVLVSTGFYAGLSFGLYWSLLVSLGLLHVYVN